MNQKQTQRNAPLLVVIALLVAGVCIVSGILAAALLRYDEQTHQRGELHPIAIEGEYSAEGGPWTPLTTETFFQNLDLRDITLRGHFTRDIPKGETLYLNLDHMRVSLQVNGEELYRLEPVEGDGNLTRAMGKQYVSIVSPGITTEDAVEMNFGNLYRNAYMIQFDELLWQMHTGSERMMFLEAVREDGWTLGIGVLFSFLTLLFLAISICCGALRNRGAMDFLWLGFASLFSSLWLLTLSPALTLIFPWPVFLNVLFSFSMQAMVICFIWFVCGSLSGWRKHLIRVVGGVLLLVLLIGLVNQLLRVHDLYDAITYASLFDIVAVLCMVFCLWYEAHHLKREEPRVLLKALFLLAVGGVLELVNGYLQFSKAAIVLGIGLLSFTILAGVSLMHRIKRSMENEKRAMVLERELEKNRISIMLSQIQPHFLYNTLTAICGLCDENPQEAKRVTVDFADYLRHNLDSLGREAPVPFARELRHIEVYLDIEKHRFEEALSVVYDISTCDFMIPSLTVQPLVENAVKHGVGKAEEGGTVTLSTQEYDEYYEIVVADDGVGFCPEEPLSEGTPHIGIENVKQRLWLMCQATLEIKSEPNVGTVATIRLPKGESLS